MGSREIVEGKHARRGTWRRHSQAWGYLSKVAAQEAVVGRQGIALGAGGQVHLRATQCDSWQWKRAPAKDSLVPRTLAVLCTQTLLVALRHREADASSRRLHRNLDRASLRRWPGRSALLGLESLCSLSRCSRCSHARGWLISLAVLDCATAPELASPRWRSTH